MMINRLCIAVRCLGACLALAFLLATAALWICLPAGWVLRRRMAAAGWGVLLASLLALGLLIARFSPADLSIRALTAVSNGGALHFPVYALPFALVVTGLAWALATVSATRHSV